MSEDYTRLVAAVRSYHRNPDMGVSAADVENMRGAVSTYQVKDTDREPVGPYAPTRTPQATINPGPMPTYPPTPGVTWASGESVVRELERVGTRLDGLLDVVLHVEERALTRDQEMNRSTTSQLTGQRDWLQEQFDALGIHIDRLADAFGADESEGGEPLITKSAANAYGRREYERGFQQGDAHRAERESDTTEAELRAALREAREHAERQYDKGVTDGRASKGADLKFKCPVDHQVERTQAQMRGFDHGKTIGHLEREAELLDAGWTPPGAITELSTGPTDHDVWYLALTIAGSQRNRRALEMENVRADAVWFYGELKGGPEAAIDRVTEAAQTEAEPTAKVEPCPECRAGKHGNCTESVLDAADEMVPCPCTDAWHDTTIT